jgi:hypothetical protein
VPLEMKHTGTQAAFAPVCVISRHPERTIFSSSVLQVDYTTPVHEQRSYHTYSSVADGLWNPRSKPFSARTG